MAIDKGHDLYLAFCEVGARLNESIARSCASLGLATTTAATVGYLGLPAAAIANEAPGPLGSRRATYRDDDEAAVCRLLETAQGTSRAATAPRSKRLATTGSARLGRAPTPPGAGGVSAGTRALRPAGRARRRAPLPECLSQDFETSGLSESEGEQFLVDVMHGVSGEACQLVMAPATGYLPADGLALTRLPANRRQAQPADHATPPEGRPFSAASGGREGFCLDACSCHPVDATMTSARAVRDPRRCSPLARHACGRVAERDAAAPAADRHARAPRRLGAHAGRLRGPPAGNPKTLGGVWFGLIKSNAEPANRYGDNGLWATLAYQMTGEARYAELAWAKIAGVPARTRRRSCAGNYSREQFIQLVLMYDWLYPALTPSSGRSSSTTLNVDGRDAC